MPLLTRDEHRFLEALSGLTFCNPFSPERIEWERQALGPLFREEGAWHRNPETAISERPNVAAITARTAVLIAELPERFAARRDDIDAETATRYEDLVVYVLYYRYFATETGGNGPSVSATVAPSRPTRASSAHRLWPGFRADHERLLQATRSAPVDVAESSHLFACLDQVRRCFARVFELILGDSRPIAQLRSMVWESVFTHDLRRYRRSLFARMADVATLITGPSGTGKELVAHAIARSQYVPFDPQRQSFAEDDRPAFIPLNLSALSPTLIESELFGHLKGSFTGAATDKLGWLERCPPCGAVFLDEIGELDPELQVKLLRVAQQRTWSRLGESSERPFVGKLMAATNRDLPAQIAVGRFRMDLYYRLCADHIHTPSLREQLDDNPAAIVSMVQLLSERIVGPAEAGGVTQLVLQWIDRSLPPQYAWPGNIRELEQCVRSIVVRNDYHPIRSIGAPSALPAAEQWLQAARERRLTMRELECAYLTWTYAQLGTYEAVAQALDLDRRTVRSRIDRDLLRTFLDPGLPVAQQAAIDSV